MKKGFLALTLVLFAGLMFLSVGVLTAADAPDMIKIENKYKDDKKGPVNSIPQEALCGLQGRLHGVPS